VYFKPTQEFNPIHPIGQARMSPEITHKPIRIYSVGLVIFFL